MLEIKVVHLSGTKRSQVEHFSALPLKLGRSAECEVVFDADRDTKVSAVHAELRRRDDDGAVLVVDLGSTNGVLLQEAAIDGPTELPNHGVLQLGPGGPRIRIDFEDTGAVSFQRLRSGADGARRGGSSGRRPPPTEEAHPTYPELAEEPASAGLPVGAVVGGALALAALGAAVFFALAL